MHLLFAASLALALGACAAPVDLGPIASGNNDAFATPYAASVQGVVDLTFIDAQTLQAVQPLTPDMVVALTQLPESLNVRADTLPSQVGSVRFDLDGNVDYHTENSAPYTILGQATTGLLAWSVAPGVHTITATPFTDPNLQGTAGKSLTVTFTIDANASLVQDANGSASQDPNASAAQNANAPMQNTNAVVTPTAPVVHIYNFTAGTADASPAFAGRIRGILVGGATIQNDTLVTTLTPSASGMRLFATTFAHYTGSFSIEQWFTWAQATPDYEAIFSISVDTQHTLMAHPERADSSMLSVDLRVGNGQQYSVTTNPPTAGALTFMAVVYDAAAQVMQLYINGTQVDSVSVPVTVSLSALAGASSTGVGGFSPFGDPAFNGTTSQFVVQPVALTAAQVAADFANPATAGR